MRAYSTAVRLSLVVALSVVCLSASGDESPDGRSPAEREFDRHALGFEKALPASELGVAKEELAAMTKATAGGKVGSAWRSVDLRIAGERLAKYAALSAERAAKLKEAQEAHDRQRALYNEGKLTEALPIAEQAANHRREVLGEESREFAAALLDVGIIRQDLGNLAAAEADYRKVMGVLKKLTGDEHPAYARIVNELGTCLEDEGKYADAIALYRQALEIRKRTLGERHFDYGRTLNNLGNVHRATTDFAAAEGYYRSAIVVFRSTTDDKQNYFARALNNLGNALNDQGRFRDAEPCYRESLEALEKSHGERHPDVAFVLSNLGWLYEHLGDYARSEAAYRRAVEIYRRTVGEKHFRFGHAVGGLAWLLKQEGNFEEAETLARQAVDINRDVYGEKHASYAGAVNTLASIYRDAERFAEAEPLQRVAAEVAKAAAGADSETHATYLQNLALVLDDQAKFAEAEPVFREALEIYRRKLGAEHPSYALTTNNLGWLKLHQNRLADAEKFLLEALRIYLKASGEDHPNTARTLRNLGLLKMTQKSYAESDDYLRRALAVQSKLLAATAVGQSERQQLAMAANLRKYLDTYFTLAAASDIDRTPVYAEALAWKGAVFVRQRAQRALADRPDLAPLAENLRKTTEQLAHLALAPADADQLDARRRRIAELTDEQQALERELALKSDAYREAKRPLEPAELQATLPDGVVLVDYWEYTHTTLPPAGTQGLPKKEPTMMAFVVAKNRPLKLVALGPAGPIRAQVDVWRKDLGKSVAAQEAGRQLRETLWDPLEPELQGAKFVLVSPDGALGMLPLGAMPAKTPDRYLLQDWAITIVPVPQAIPVLLEEQRREAPKGNLFLLGGVDYDAQTAPADAPKVKKQFGTRRAARFGDAEAFGPLEFTKDEVAALKRKYNENFGADGVALLEGSQANEQAFRREAPQYRYLHVATHGFFAPPELTSALTGTRGGDGDGADYAGGISPGLLSGLAFAGANHPQLEGEDGILTAEEASTLDLTRVDLVVLSACETGLGPVAGGEGILSLQRSFQVAGARTVVASLWKVSDRETRDLMQRFYANLWDRELPMLEALREAQLWMMKEGPKRDVRLTTKPGGATRDAEPVHAPPYYWASFVLSGDWR